MKRAINALVMASLLAIAIPSYAAFTQMVVFGESTSSINGSAGGAYDPDTWSNGLNWTESLASYLGVSITPSAIGGNSYAYGGATTTAMQGQIDGYLSSVGGVADSGKLYVIWGGANDTLTADDMAGAATNIRAGINNLISAGANNFLVLNLFDLGLAPIGSSQGTLLTQDYNTHLASELSSLGSTVNLFTVDVFSLINSVVDDPASYGLTNIVDNCYDGLPFGSGTNALCSNPEDYLWWDTGHFTEVGNDIIANAAITAITPVPLPATAWLFLSAMGGLIGLKRAARSR